MSTQITFSDKCPECRQPSIRSPQHDIGNHIKGYQCSSGHLFRMDAQGKILSVFIPFKELESCPKCGRMNLKKVHDQQYPDENGIARHVIYRCPMGHETKVQHLQVREFNIPPKEQWEGWY